MEPLLWVQQNAVVFDSSNNKVVIAYKDAGNSDHGTAIVGTVSGTSISYGSAVVFNAGETSMILSPDSEFFKFFGNIKPKSE